MTAPREAPGVLSFAMTDVPRSAQFYDTTDPDPRVERIHHLRRLILLHSTIYYRFDTTLVPDHVYDAWARELGKLQSEAPEAAAKVVWMRDEFSAFDGTSTTGFNLPLDDPWATFMAAELLRLRGA